MFTVGQKVRLKKEEVIRCEKIIKGDIFIVIEVKQFCGINMLVLNEYPTIAFTSEIFEGGEVLKVSSDYNTKCSKCGSPAYQGFLKIDCSKGCF